jgi:hypothetical protein
MLAAATWQKAEGNRVDATCRPESTTAPLQQFLVWHSTSSASWIAMPDTEADARGRAIENTKKDFFVIACGGTAGANAAKKKEVDVM